MELTLAESSATYVVPKPMLLPAIGACLATFTAGFLIFEANNTSYAWWSLSWPASCAIAYFCLGVFYWSLIREHCLSVTLNLASKTIDVGFRRLLTEPVVFTYSGKDISKIEWEEHKVRLYCIDKRLVDLSLDVSLNSAKLPAEEFADAIASALGLPSDKVTYKDRSSGG